MDLLYLDPNIPIADNDGKPSDLFQEQFRTLIDAFGGQGQSTVLQQGDVSGSVGQLAKFVTTSSLQGSNVVVDNDGRLAHVGQVSFYQVTVSVAQLNAGPVALLVAAAGERWRVRSLRAWPGTNFDAGGDRLLAIGQGSTVFSLVPVASLKTQVVSSWGAVGLPYPATPAHGTVATAAGESITASYSGGTTDYTSGSLTIVLEAERVT